MRFARNLTLHRQATQDQTVSNCRLNLI